MDVIFEIHPPRSFNQMGSFLPKVNTAVSKVMCIR